MTDTPRDKKPRTLWDDVAELRAVKADWPDNPIAEILAENEDETMARHMQAVCFDCGRQYGDEYGFPDLNVPHDVWRVISPTGHEGGLLCPSCLCRRAHLAGLRNIDAEFGSGPFCKHTPCHHEWKNEAMVNECRTILRHYLVPDSGITPKDAISRLLGVLDSEETKP